MAALIEFQLPIVVVAIPMPAQGQKRHKLLPLTVATRDMGKIVPEVAGIEALAANVNHFTLGQLDPMHRLNGKAGLSRRLTVPQLPAPGSDSGH